MLIFPTLKIEPIKISMYGSKFIFHRDCLKINYLDNIDKCETHNSYKTA